MLKKISHNSYKKPENNPVKLFLSNHIDSYTRSLHTTRELLRPFLYYLLSFVSVEKNIDSQSFLSQYEQFDTIDWNACESFFVEKPVPMQNTPLPKLRVNASTQDKLNSWTELLPKLKVQKSACRIVIYNVDSESFSKSLQNRFLDEFIRNKLNARAFSK